jgi:hypothetical protein
LFPHSTYSEVTLHPLFDFFSGEKKMQTRRNRLLPDT